MACSLVAGSAAGAVKALREAGRPRSQYFEAHGLDAEIETMLEGLDSAQPDDPYMWMIRYLSDRRRVRNGGIETVSVTNGARQAGGKSRRINISACLKRSCRPLLDIVLESPEWKAIEDPADTACDVFFVWSGQALLARLAHPAASAREAKVPQLPAEAWINRFPGMGCMCDKVNMALALRLLQKLWPEKFRFWPKSWLLPNEADILNNWLEKHKGETVIVKPEGGSQGEGIFLVQSSADLRVKLSAKSNWGAGFGALAQRYLPSPLLLDGLKFDLRLYVVVTCLDPLCAYLCKEGLARFCTAKYQEPTAANANDVYMHLTNYSVNKKSVNFSDEDPFNVNSRASKRPIATLMAQIAAQEAAEGRTFDESKLYSAFEEVCAVLLQAIAPVLTATYDRVAKEAQPKPKAKPTSPGRRSPPRKKRVDDSDEEEEEEEDEDDDDEDFSPSCFQVLGVDVLLDAKLQPWLLEVNARPSMEVSNPVRLADAPPGSRRCVCRDMDGEEHCHIESAIDVHVKRMVVDGAFKLVSGDGMNGSAPGFTKMNFDRYSPSEAQETLQAVTRIYKAAGGAKKAFTTSGLRKALAGAISDGMSAHDLDSAVSRWKHQGYRQDAHSEEDNAEIGVLDFANLLEEVACIKAGSTDDPLDALASLISLCDPEE